MVCSFKKLIFPPRAEDITDGCYMVAIYKPCEKIVDASGVPITEFKAVGHCLPVAGNLRYDMAGHWNKTAKHGLQFEVKDFKEVVTPNREGIIAYLSSGQIKGIGPKIAERIYGEFGDKTLEVLDKQPQKLLTISGISSGKLKKICDSYLASRGARDIVAFLTPHGITPNRAVQFYKIYGNRTMETVQNHPYRLCEIPGIGFHIADKIALSMGLAKVSPERVDEGLIFTLKEAESGGNLCMEKHEFISYCLKLLDTPELTEEMVANRAARLVHDGKLSCYQGMVYRGPVANVEQELTDLLNIHKRKRPPVSYPNIGSELEKEESKLGIRLDPEQKSAVLTALQSNLCVITGGPGTGKTSIQRAILDLYRKHNPDNDIVCCAPTGRAARRMEQSTGFPASTVHKALGLLAGDDGTYNEPTGLEADLVLVDEVSMLDIYLARDLVSALQENCQLVLIGDADQLPSVGPGAVLSEIIESGVISVVRLDRVHRQNSGSLIALNAKRIRHGNLNLDEGDNFQIRESSDLAVSAEIIEKLYLQEADKYGVDNVALLSPFRQKTATGVNALNEVIRDKINPPSPEKEEVKIGKQVFRLGDRVMQMRNRDDINNGDIGYVIGIYGRNRDAVVQVDFGDGRITEYDTSEIGMLELGYASTIHKSQGGEYQSVIINLQCAHNRMLIRPLIYTAITRAKERVLIVGERRALCIAIKRAGVTSNSAKKLNRPQKQRGTMLAERLRACN